MRIGRHSVLWLTLCWVLATVLVTDLLWFARGGASEVNSGRDGVLVPAVAAGPVFTDPPAVLTPDDDSAEPPTEAGLTTALSALLTDSRLGSSVAVSVRDAENGTTLFSRNADTPVTPASTTKTVTAAGVLLAYGPAHRLTTKVVKGATEGEIVIVGGGDPTLAFGEKMSYPGSARLDVLAKDVKTALNGAPVTRIVVDGTLFSGPTVGPGWDDDIISGNYSAHVNALTANGARVEPTPDHEGDRTLTPDLFVGQRFAGLLGAGDAEVVQGTAPEGAESVAELQSPPLSHIVDAMLTESDNVIAEAMLRLTAVKKGLPATFDGGTQARKAVLDEAGIDTAGYGLRDGSGLSRLNRLTPNLLTSLLAKAVGTEHPQLRTLLAGLPVASYSGTLADRFGGNSATAGVGIVRAKTGTLSGVSSLAGMTITVEGRILTFAAVANGVPNGGTDSAEAALDQIAATLAKCGCK
ncbi:D-alanyl-D-alanine carboxypeptidase/D-alanyl-D-alanine endopeptidase [Cryptosporangium arvum]|uniref:D-alanyl-D-alanine carboxypeptidase, serine-type, PBP4 family n=1 Tax=Cryptosporangium arvum DSM 44712 TaxID=927661 RepID=A0A010YW47_9ACTN|nr:D-alanyl-D-alanine carboxypeptidase/D-alanyl-D-alanine-endopeptidase [Cryptosporangium arvum]EXG79363.1 D-alanyl-D-alanine carboxypeptidase, serine-type, PBP4 family [Cryptosporangium arvum DSM 44712]